MTLCGEEDENCLKAIAYTSGVAEFMHVYVSVMPEENSGTPLFRTPWGLQKVS